MLAAIKTAVRMPPCSTYPKPLIGINQTRASYTATNLCSQAQGYDILFKVSESRELLQMSYFKYGMPFQCRDSLLNKFNSVSASFVEIHENMRCWRLRRKAAFKRDRDQ